MPAPMHYGSRPGVIDQNIGLPCPHQQHVNITHMSWWTQRTMGRRRGAKWHYTAPPPTGNGPGPEL